MIATARKSDPIQCFIAAEKVNHSLTKAQQFALDCINTYPGHTAKELEKIVGCDYGRIHKRCNELAAAKKITRLYRADRDGWLLYPVKQFNESLF